MAEEKKYKELKKIISQLEKETEKAKKLLAELADQKSLNDQEQKNYQQELEEVDDLLKNKDLNQIKIGEEVIIEGVFNGQLMIGADGKQYSVPANYASKSKLVEGDILKLKIDKYGNFVFKQIGPVERTRKIGVVTYDDEGELSIIAEGKKYKVIKASLTYFKAEEGDEVVILLPKDMESEWAAIENIIKKETILKINQEK